MRLRTQKATSSKGTGLQSATIKLGNGDWVITQLSYAEGDHERSVMRFAYRHKDSGGNWIESYLGGGYSIGPHWIVMAPTPIEMKGPGQVISWAIHDANSDHELRMTYRRLRK